MIALFFDTETTGLPSADYKPDIVQIGLILQNTETKKVYAELNLLVRTFKEIPEQVIAVHGITPKIADRMGVTVDIADNMFAQLASKAHILVAHNIDFDKAVIDGVWDISKNIIQDITQYCTMRSCARFDDMPRKHANKNQYTKLTDAYKYFFDVELENAHDAMADVRACRDIYFKLEETM